MENWISDHILERLSTPSSIRKMYADCKQKEAEYGSQAVFDFSLGNPVVDPPEEFSIKGMELFLRSKSGQHSYIDHLGLTPARTKIAEHLNDKYDTQLTSTDIVMTCGAAGGLNVILKSILNPADEVIVFTPYFPEYDAYIRNYGGNPVYVKLDSDFQIDLQALMTAITPRTRAVLINSPHNPTGKAFSRNQLTQVHELIYQYEQQYKQPIYILFDAPYDQLYYGDYICNPFAIFNRMLFVGSFSKDFGIAGERLGYIVLPEHLEGKDLLREAFSYSIRALGFVNAPVLVQRIIAEMKTLEIDPVPYRERRDLMVQVLQNAGYHVKVPDGGIFIFPESPIEDDILFCNQLANLHNIYTVPGSSFQAPGYIRISFSTSLDTITLSETGFRKARLTAASLNTYPSL